MDWLAEYIKAWSRHGIHFGISCSPGKCNQGRYQTLLSPINILDPNPELPAHVTLALSADDECLIYRFPYRYRKKELRGELNDRFLDPSSLLRVLDGMRQGSIILLSIPQIYATEGLSFETFLEKFDRFLSALPNALRYATELQNPRYLFPDYFACLRKHRVAHVIRDDVAFTTDFGLVRGVESFADIDHAIHRALDEKKVLYLYFDGEEVLRHMMEGLNHRLRLLSPIKKTHAA